MTVLALLFGVLGVALLANAPRSERQAVSARHCRVSSWQAALVAGAAVALLIGGLRGAAIGAAGVVAVRVVVGRLESQSHRGVRLAFDAQLPDVLDLIAACIYSGAPPQHALGLVATASPEPIATALVQVHSGLGLGATLEHAIAEEPELAPLGAVLARSDESGAALAARLSATAADLRARQAAAILVRVRRLGVSLTGPLALAFLPAFVLLGVVPVIAALLRSVLP